MSTIKGAIIAMNPLCTSNFLKDKTDLALEHILSYYQEREKWIDYYIKILKITYAKYGYDDPFTTYGKEDQRFINADFGSKSMQSKIKIVNKYEATWSKGISESINEYIYRRWSKYFKENYNSEGKYYFKDNPCTDTTYKCYFYLLALDETLYSFYKENKKYLNKVNSNLKHRDLIEDYVINALGIKEKNYTNEPAYITLEELKQMGLDEVPDNYELDNFLGPKGPGR